MIVIKGLLLAIGIVASVAILYVVAIRPKKTVPRWSGVVILIGGIALIGLAFLLEKDSTIHLSTCSGIIGVIFTLGGGIHTLFWGKD
ncbi:MAG: hypothetical protein WC480_00400 [Patescibacteria group bacterium]